MKSVLSVMFSGILIVGHTSFVIGQDPGINGSDGRSQDKRGPVIKSLNSLISEIFAPVTEKLNLTQEQRLRIVGIIIETEVNADPLLQSLAVFDQQLSELTFSEVLNENRLQEICDYEAAILSELTKLKIRAKARIVGLLTAEQRAILTQQFQMKAQVEGHLGAISIY
jgi:hypothetical protein